MGNKSKLGHDHKLIVNQYLVHLLFTLLSPYTRPGVAALIYLGETSRVYVSLHNGSQKLATDIVLKVLVDINIS